MEPAEALVVRAIGGAAPLVGFVIGQEVHRDCVGRVRCKRLVKRADPLDMGRIRRRILPPGLNEDVVSRLTMGVGGCVGSRGRLGLTPWRDEHRRPSGGPVGPVGSNRLDDIIRQCVEILAAQIGADRAQTLPGLLELRVRPGLIESTNGFPHERSGPSTGRPSSGGPA